VIKSRRIRWTEYVARLEEGRGVYRILVRKPEGHQWGDQGVDGRIILRWIFKELNVGVWTRLIWLGIETGGGQL
jgi:hypothetical protein